jgi:hypothetical protein
MWICFIAAVTKGVMSRLRGNRTVEHRRKYRFLTLVSIGGLDKQIKGKENKNGKFGVGYFTAPSPRGL